MARIIPFTKMHGAGNDYIYINIIDQPLENPEKLSVEWSDRHKGIGADGLVLIGSSDKADLSMRIFNADGSEAMMCGNATRCIAKYAYEKGLTTKKIITLDTLSGIKELNLSVENEIVKEVTVDMGKPVIENINLSLQIDGKTWTGTVVSMGNPHFVIFVNKVETINLPIIGEAIENHPLFHPNRTNVEFVEIYSPKEMRMRVWERGSGITMACGTGACASLVAAVATKRAEHSAKVIMDGGEVFIQWNENDQVLKTGPATTVFEGTILLNA